MTSADRGRTEVLRRPTIVAGVLLAALGLSVVYIPAAAQGSPADEGAIFLLLPVGARAVALGRAATALPGAESVWWNPAGLAEVSEGRVLLYQGDHGLSGEATAVSTVLTHDLLGALGVSYELVDVGSSDVTDGQQNVVGTTGRRFHLGVISLATRLDRLSVGLNLKVLQDRASCRGECMDAGVTATTFALDAGLQAANLLGLPLRLGAMVAHAGPGLQVVNAGQADPLPTRVRVAAAYELLGHFLETEELSFTLAVEVEDRWLARGSPTTYVGSELSAGSGDMVYVRAGRVFGASRQVDGSGVGIGVRWERFDLSLAKSAPLLAGTGDPVHVAFGLVF